MSKKKLLSIVLSALLAILAAILGCAFGIEVDFSGVDVTPESSVVEIAD